MIDELLKYLDISDEVKEPISENKWEINLNNANAFTKINSILTKDTDFMEVPDNELMSIDLVITEYRSSEFDIILEANLEKDTYIVTIEELNND